MATSLWRCFTLEPTCTAGGGLSGTAVWGPVGIVALAPVHTAVSALVGIAVVAPRNTAVVAQSGTAALTLARKPGSKIFSSRFPVFQPDESLVNSSALEPFDTVGSAPGSENQIKISPRNVP